MSRSGSRHVAVLTYPGAQALDVVGPLEVFHGAARIAPNAYRVELLGLGAEPQPTSSGYALVPQRAYASVRKLDTLLVAGGSGSRELRHDRRLTTWLSRMAPRCRRIGAVCTGAFVLAAAGLLEGRRVTTHWAAAQALARICPGARVDPDPIFVRDGKLFTSAGVTAGIDLALALVEEDLGRDVAREVARHLVVYLKRPGGQAQFSAPLRAQVEQESPLSDVSQYVVEHPGRDLSVEALARRAGMSPRNFARRFRQATGQTPARYVRSVRLEAARRALEESDAPVEAVAEGSGFGTDESLRRAFVHALGTSPQEYRKTFGRRSV
jgi:transcriptional regulator GlxA family with amidase domain